MWKRNLALPSQADHDGISFLWVVGVVAEIRRRKYPQEMIAAVRKLPETMAAAYNLLSRDIDQTDRAAMLFISLASRSLTVGELENLVAVWFKATEPEDRWDFRPNNFLERESNTNTVRLTHFSIREWILSKIDPDSAAAVSKALGSLIPVHDAQGPSTIFVPDENEPSYYQDDDARSVHSYSPTLFSKESLMPPMQPSWHSNLQPLEAQFAELFLEQAELRVLTLEFLKVRGRYGFEETFTTLLKAYSAVLIQIAPSTTAKVAALLAGDKATQISSAMTQASGYLNGSITATRSDIRGGSTAKDSDFLMDKFFKSLDVPAEGLTSSSNAHDLGSQAATSTKLQHPVTGNIKRSEIAARAAAANEATASEEFADGLYVDLSGVKVWLVTAPPFLQMLEQLAGKLNPREILPLIPGVETATSTTTSRSSLHVFLGVVFRFLLLVIPGGEEPLPDGFKRVRWTCVSIGTTLKKITEVLTYEEQFCGRHLYDDFCEVIPGSVSKIQTALDSAYRPSKAMPMSDGDISARSRAPIMRHGVSVAFFAVLIALRLVSPLEWPWARIAATSIYGCVLSIIAAVFSVLLLLAHQNWSEPRPHLPLSIGAASAKANAPLYDEHDMDEAGSWREHSHANRGDAEQGQVHVQGQSSNPSTTAAASASRGQSIAEAGASDQRRVVSSHGQDSGSESDSHHGSHSIYERGKAPSRDSNSSHDSDSEVEDGRRHGVELERLQIPDERRWILALFENNHRDDIYVHLNARIKNCDFTLFEGLKQKYHQISSRWSRFWQLKQVQALRVVQVSIVNLYFFSLHTFQV